MPRLLRLPPGFQVSVFLVGDHTVLSIQHTPSQINGLLLARIMYAGSKIRLNGPKVRAHIMQTL
jgi:hypothetical protein